MHCITLRALVVQSLFLLLPAILAVGHDDTTTTTTLTSTTTISTITTTVSARESTYASTTAIESTSTGNSIGSITTETAEKVGSTTAVAGDSSQPTITGTALATGTGTGSSVAALSGAISYSGAAFESAVINSTNYFRAQHQASALKWDDTLASYAQAHAEKCVWRHSGGPYGENIAAGYNDPLSAIDAWADEEKHYNYEKSHFTKKAGHFTQLVWKNTTMVGCGAVHCNIDASNGVKGWYLVCEYSPAGNAAGQFQREVTKSGEGSDGVPGFGTASSTRSTTRLLGALVAAYMLLAMGGV